MIAATLFSGIGAPEAAMPTWHWTWGSEIDPFACAVLNHRHPHSINLRDILANDFSEKALKIARPDVLVFGSPCQSFSIAGKRLGLDDPRGNLALVALRVIGNVRPRWFIFENVPGLLSSDKGKDLETFFRTVGKLGYSLAWTVLDAQHFGVAQRRRRLFAVGYIGDWRSPAAILLEPESLCGHHPPSRKARERIADSLTVGANQYSGFWGEPVSAISAKWHKGTGGPSGDECQNLVAHTYALDSSSAGRTTEDGTGVPPAITVSSAVRRLTPRECERLQGYPDDYTLITYRGKPAADGPRYKALGNSMAVPVIEWILSRIEHLEKKKA